MVLKRFNLLFSKFKFIFIGIAIAFFLKADVFDHTKTEMVLANIGDMINTSGDEFYPSITDDGSKMVFSVRPLDADTSDIYMSIFKNGAWQKAQPIAEINSKYDDQTPYISPDGRIIIFSSNREGTIRPPKVPRKVYYYTNDLYITKFENGRWSNPKRLEGDVNTQENERAPSLSRDGKILYFSRYPGNSIEQSKIYQAQFDGVMATDVKLLPYPINSGYSDFGLLESRTRPGFYFSSSRPNGLGLWDIYFVSFVNGKYGEPINLGSPVNSDANELAITEIGNVVFFCSDRQGGKGNCDIYTITLSPKIFKVPDTGFIFSILNKETNQPVSAEFRITIKDDYRESAKREKIKMHKSSLSGILEIKVPVTTKEIIVETFVEHFEPFKQRYVPIQGSMQKIQIYLNPFYAEDIPLQAEEPKVEFRSIYFEFASWQIPMSEMPHLMAIVQKLREDNTLCIKIIGHTDAKGGEAFNMRLGFKRAMAVRDAFVHFGLSRFRYKIESKGERQPSEEYYRSGEDRYNRRVEFEIIECDAIDDED